MTGYISSRQPLTYPP